MGTGVDNGAPPPYSPPPGPPWRPQPAAPPQQWTPSDQSWPAAPPHPGHQPAAHPTGHPGQPPATGYARPPATGHPGPAPTASPYTTAPPAGPYAAPPADLYAPPAGPYAVPPTAPPADPYAVPPTAPPADPYAVPPTAPPVDPRTAPPGTSYAAAPPAPLPPSYGRNAPPAPAPVPSAGRRARAAARVPLAAAVCLVLGIGLLCGAGAGALLGGGESPAAHAARAYSTARDLWHDKPVDTLFPRTVQGRKAGPGDSDRTWTRIGVAPDSGCAGAFDPALAKVLAPAGCVRLLRATYTDATSTDVTTVGILTTRATPAAMAALRTRLSHLGGPAAMPSPVPFPGTPAAHFGPVQRGSWTVDVSSTLPVVVYAVSGFADGRAVTAPQAASAADVPGTDTVPGRAGLGFEAAGLATAVNRHLTSVAGVPHPEETS
ncbi:hypothetical protein [Streptantibioticus silvisoli]|uniref:Uncharacterized protein n=1 Tax=Streptantibioticus silvisoli TaxID=2705255 RepID=A0ABT6W6N5_9ACTN|nr:hypothetical protein [Streptantibioticus silvisoli]MDI5966055.1 hypothetical protein [Streptantibioticus silvisoli]